MHLVLACAAYLEDDFAFLTSLMQRTAQIIDPANSRKLKSAHAVIKGFRNQPGRPIQVTPTITMSPKDQIDLLLDPRALDEHTDLTRGG